MSLVFISAISITSAEETSRWLYGNSPTEVLDRVVWEANKKVEIQETALDNIDDTQWWYQGQYKISNTLDYLRMNIAPYLQWMVYIWLVVAVILVVYNWFLMVTHTINKSWDFGKIKKNLWYITIWVLLLTGFYAIIKILVWLINSVFWTSGSWDTGF